MEKAILGKKVGMTQIFSEDGRVIPVTVIQAGPCVVTQLKTLEKDGYEAAQLGYGDISESRISKPEKGHLNKAGVPLKKYLKEFRLSGLNVGDEVTAAVFSVNDRVDVTGISKGKGYAGTIKRFGGHRGPESHGGGPVHRHQGSMGANSDPSRVFPGKTMPGHMGVEQVTVQNLTVALVDPELNVIAVRGAVPGPRGGLVSVKATVKNN
ncbi:MAG: 50S ribosomal protein L3 [Oscillospiraceae bacterium]|jgi:large subunit ribosomal protein L3|nr:50S ribosomal protein L3 [Oscillospiraceae bacterium]